MKSKKVIGCYEASLIYFETAFNLMIGCNENFNYQLSYESIFENCVDPLKFLINDN